MGLPISAAEMGVLQSQAGAMSGSASPPSRGTTVRRLRETASSSGQVGRLTAEIRRPTAAPFETLIVRPSALALVMPLSGGCSLISNGVRLDGPTRTCLLLTRAGPAMLTWQAGSVGLLVQLPRTSLQAVASARLGDARRLASACLQLTDDPLAALMGALETVVSAHGVSAGLIDAETPLSAAIVRAVAEQADADTLFPIVRSVSQAMRHVRANLKAPCDAESLARVVGVTPETLRTSFRTCLGARLSDYVWRVRLDWMRERLSSCRESRSIRDLALEAGFRDAPAFSRAYLRTFHEAPTETRSRAVRAMT